MEIRVAMIATTLTTTVALGLTLLGTQQMAGASAVAGAPQQATDLTLSVSQHRVGPGEPVKLLGELQLESDGSVVGGEDVRLQWQRVGKPGWREGGAASTGAKGMVRWSLELPESRRFRLVFDGTAGLAASTSAVSKVFMKPIVTASASRDWVTRDGTVKIRARVRPAFDGEFVTLQRRHDGQWRDVRRKRQGGQGRVDFRVGGRAHYGLQKYRVALDERDAHLAAASGRIEIRTVRLVTYVIETRGKVKSALPSFRQRTAEIYADPRGWTRANVHFKKVKSGGAFSLVLSAAKYVPTFAPICDRYWSCRVGRYVIINEDRWRHGTPYFKSAGGNLRQYRAMVVNHETGHWFGLGHASCGGQGRLAPVMMQQSKGLNGCKPNAWPLPWEIRAAY